MSSQNVLFFGASRGTGFFAMLRVVRAGGHATLLLRKPEAVTDNPEFQALSTEERERATLIKGDAFVREDVARVVDAAGPGMDTVVFSLGGAPSKMTLSRGVLVEPRQPTARAITTILSVLEELNRPGLRLVIVSTMGMGEKAKELPFLFKGVLYGWLLHDAHTDKAALEYMCLRASKFPTPAKLPEEGTMPEAAASLRTNWLEELIILRPGWFTDGKETGTVRAAPSLPGAYTISRRDVGWFITEECLKGSNKWVGGEGVVIAY